MNWNREKTFGLLIGVLWPMIFMPVVLLIISVSQNQSYKYIWEITFSSSEFTSRYLSLALISNLLWFYFFLNRQKYQLVYGIIIGMIVYVPYMVYVNLIK